MFIVYTTKVKMQRLVGLQDQGRTVLVCSRFKGGFAKAKNRFGPNDPTLRPGQDVCS